MPLRLQNSTHFEIVRKHLRSIGFCEKSICDRLGIPALRDLLSRTGMAPKALHDSDELGLLTRLLLLGESFPREELEAILTAPIVESLAALGLVNVDTANDGRLSCPVALYPYESVFIVSDRWFGLDGKYFTYPEDFVYPAISPNTAEFTGALPATPCESFLELCSGAGATALAASAYARKCWAIDITERSTHMAEFNRLLNELDNVTVLRGDLYEGVEHLQFDRIVAHPPYMPVLRPEQIFYGGGADGEQITRRIIEGLPRFLKAGGCFYCLAQGSDRKGAPLEERVRAWLGDAQAEFDVAVLERRVKEPQDAAFTAALKSEGGFKAANIMIENLTRLGVESMVFGWIVVQRRNCDRKVFTVRRSAGHPTAAEEMNWLLKWETFAAAASAPQDLLSMCPRARGSLELRTIHRIKGSEFLPEQLALHTEDPFAMDCRVDPWVTFLIPLCDGRTTIHELWEKCKAQKFVHPETPPEEFAKLLSVFVSGGFLEVDDYRPPGPA